LLGLAAVVGGIIFIARRSKKSAQDGSLEIAASPTASKSEPSPPAKEAEMAAKKTVKKTTEEKPAPIVCKSCGEGIKSNAKTCSHCGAPQSGGKE
jgi:ribosomal protein L37E